MALNWLATGICSTASLAAFLSGEVTLGAVNLAMAVANWICAICAVRN